MNSWFKTFVFTHLLSFASGGVVGFFVGRFYERPLRWYIHHNLINNIIELVRLLHFWSRTLALVVWYSAITASYTSINVTTGTIIIASLTIPEVSSVAASQTVIVISGHHDLHLTRKTDRSHLRAGFAWVARTTQTATVQANTVSVAFVGAPLDRTYFLEWFRTG